MLCQFEQAGKAFNNKKYKKAFLLYGNYVASKKTTPDKKEAALFMITYLCLRKGDFQQALIYYKLLSHPVNKSFLPELKGSNLLNFIAIAPLFVIKNYKMPNLDLAGYGLKGEGFKEIIEALRQKPNITHFSFRDNPLNEIEVNYFLNFLLTRKKIADVDLSGLPLNNEALQKIINLIKKVEAKAIEFVNSSFKITLTNGYLSDNILLLQALKKARTQKIVIEFADSKLQKHILRVSHAFSQEIMDKQKCKFTRQLDSLARQSNHVLNKLADTSSFPKINSLVQAVVYNRQKEVGAHIINKEGDIFINICKLSIFNLSELKDLMPCKSLTIYAPESKIINDGALSILGLMRVVCQDLVSRSQANIKTGQMIVYSKNKIILDGKTNSDHLQLESQSVLIKPFLDMDCQKNQLALINIVANSIDIEGGRIKAHVLKIKSKTHFTLPETLSLEGENIQLNSDKDIYIRSRIKSGMFMAEALGKVQLCQGARIQTTRCSLAARDIILRNELKDCDLLQLQAERSARLATLSNISASKIQVNGEEIECLGRLRFDNFRITSGKARLGGHLIGQTESSHGDEQKDNNVPAFFFSIESSALEIDGEIEIDNMLSILVDKLYLSFRASIKPYSLDKKAQKQESWVSQIICKEKLYLNEGSKISRLHSLKIETKDLALYGKIHSTDNIYLEVNGTGKIHDHGKLFSDKNINFEGSRCWNSGEIKAIGFLNIAFDRFFINGLCDFNLIEKLKEGKLLGKLSGENITITTAFFLGVLSDINTNTLQINSFVHIYVGLINAKIINRSNIVGINLGLNITAIKTVQGVVELVREVVAATSQPDKSVKSLIKSYIDPLDGKVIAMNGVTYALALAGIAAKLLTVFAPQIGLPINLILGSINLLAQLALNGLTLKQEITKLIERFQSGKKINTRHIIPLIVNIKDIGLTAANIVPMGLGLPNAFTHLPEQIQGSHESLLSVLPNLTGILGGSIRDQSIFQFNGLNATVTGLLSTTSAIQTSIFSQDLTAVSFVNSFISQQEFSSIVSAIHSVNTFQYKEENGYQLAQSEMITAKEASLGGNIIVSQLNIVADNLQQKGTLHAQTAQVNTQATKIKGQVDIKSGAISSCKLQIEEGADANFAQTFFDLKGIEVQGAVSFYHANGHLGKLTENQTGVIKIEGEIKDKQYQYAFELTEGNLKGQISLKNACLISPGKIDFVGSTLSTGSLIKSSTLTLVEKSSSQFKNTMVEGQLLSQKEGSLLAADNTFFIENNVILQGITHVDNKFAVKADNKISIGASGKIEKGDDSEVILFSRSLDKQGEVDAHKIIFRAHFTTQEVNRLGTDKKLHAYECQILTDQDIGINKQFTVAPKMTIVAASIKDNAKQHLTSLWLESTRGNVELNQRNDACGNTTVMAEGKILINAGINSKEINAYGKKGIECLPIHKQERVLINGQAIHFKSDGGMSFEDTELKCKNLTLDAKKDIRFGKQKPIYKINSFLRSQTQKSKHNPVLDCTNAHIKGANLINNGQTLQGDYIWIDLTYDLCNKNIGIIHANHFLGATARNITNESKVINVQNEHGVHQEYAPSYLWGGDGRDTNGIGMHLHAQKLIVNDASNMQSVASNLFEADEGFQSIARSSICTTSKKDKSHFFGLRQKHIEVKETIVSRSSVVSQTGQNNIISRKGSVKLVATDCEATEGTFVQTKGDAKFYDLKGSTQVNKSSRSFGVFYSNEKSYDEFSSPTVIKDKKDITIISENQKYRGTYVLTPCHFLSRGKEFGM